MLNANDSLSPLNVTPLNHLLGLKMPLSVILAMNSVLNPNESTYNMCLSKILIGSYTFYAFENYDN